MARFCEDVIADDNPAPASAIIRLCNFDTGKSGLLPDHVTALQQWIIEPAWPTTHAWIDVVGHASKMAYQPGKGDNWTLSVARCEAVRTFLNKTFFKLFNPPFSNVRVGVAEGEGEFHRPGVGMGVGATQSEGDPTTDQNHGFFRAVEVKLYSQGKYEWKNRKPLRHGYTTAASNSFEFEGVEYASADFSKGAASVGTTCLIFGIHDRSNHRRRYFGFAGVANGASIPSNLGKVSLPGKYIPAISFSAEHNSPPQRFTTKVAVLDLEDFVGSGTLVGKPGITIADVISKGGSQTLSWTPQAYLDRGVNSPLSITFSFSRGFGVGLWNGGSGLVFLLDSSFRPTVYSR